MCENTGNFTKSPITAGIMIRLALVVNFGMHGPRYSREIGVFTLLGVIYLLTQNPYAGFGDGLGFLYYAERGFDWGTNATSHFLYANLNHLALQLLPFLPPARVLGSLSALFALLALFQLYQLIVHLHQDRNVALLGVLCIGLSFSWWRQAVSIEVYALNAFLVMRMLLLLVRADEGPHSRSLGPLGFWYGLALLTHIQNILLLPLFLYRIGMGIRKKERGAGLALLMGGLLTGILFLPPLLWQTNSIKAIFFDRQFAGSVLNVDLLTLGKGFLRSLAYLCYNFHVFLPLLLRGFVRWLWADLRLGILLGGSAALFWAFAMRYDVTDNYVFFLLPYFVLVAGGARGLQWPEKRRFPAKLALYVLVPFLVYGLSTVGLRQVPAVQIWAVPKAFKGGAAYYLWPGRSQAPNPLQLAREIQAGQRPAIPDFDRYPLALEYLEWQEAQQVVKEYP